MRPATFHLDLHSYSEIPPKASPERKARINELRNKRNAELRAAGALPRQPYRRYVGI
jgi:hypothetical protein